MDDGVNYRLWKKCIFVLDISSGLACGLDRRDKPGNYLYRTSRQGSQVGWAHISHPCFGWFVPRLNGSPLGILSVFCRRCAIAVYLLEI